MSDITEIRHRMKAYREGLSEEEILKLSKEIENRENILNLRLFGIYGSGEDESRVTSCIVNAKLKNKPVLLNQNVRFHFIWIEDFCKIVKHFIEHSTKEKFLNVTPNESVEIIELAKILGVETIVKKEGLNKEYTGDNSLLLKEIPSFQFTDMKAGLESMCKTYKALLFK